MRSKRKTFSTLNFYKVNHEQLIDNDLIRDIKMTPEEEERIINKVAVEINKRGMDMPAILMLETLKPLVYIGTQFGRFYVSPFLPIFGDAFYQDSEKIITIFEKRENVEKLIKRLEEISKEEKKNKEKPQKKE
jgi:hypothetical protein